MCSEWLSRIISPYWLAGWSSCMLRAASSSAIKTFSQETRVPPSPRRGGPMTSPARRETHENTVCVTFSKTCWIHKYASHAASHLFYFFLISLVSIVAECFPLVSQRVAATAVVHIKMKRKKKNLWQINIEAAAMKSAMRSAADMWVCFHEKTDIKCTAWFLIWTSIGWTA